MVRRLAGVLLVALVTGVGAPAAAPAASPREPDEYGQIRRELRIGSDVLRAALADALPESRRVLDVEAGYLAGQGVLVVVDLGSPWFRVGGRGIDVDPDLTSLEQIPAMVQEILDELNLGLSRHQVEDLKELREIREAQRAVRAEQRALRSQLREKRRTLQRTGDDRAADVLRGEIDALQADFAAAEDEERTLEEDAATVRETVDRPADQAARAAAPAASLDVAVAEAVCGYGATFKSLAAQQRLNVLVRQARVSRYFVFEMAQVRKCQAGGMDAAELLGESLVYES